MSPPKGPHILFIIVESAVDGDPRQSGLNTAQLSILPNSPTVGCKFSTNRDVHHRDELIDRALLSVFCVRSLWGEPISTIVETITGRMPGLLQRDGILSRSLASMREELSD